MNKLIIKSQEIPFKTGLYSLQDNTIVKISCCKNVFSTVVVDKFKFDYPKVKALDISVEEYNVYCLGIDKYVYKLVWGKGPIFKRMDFRSSIYIPDKFNNCLSEMWGLSNFKAEKYKIFSPISKKSNIISNHSMEVLDLENELRNFYREGYKAREY